MNNKTLGIVFGILLIIVAVIFISQSGKNERTFREVLVDIDTSAVTEVLIYPKSKNPNEVKLFKDKNIPFKFSFCIQLSHIAFNFFSFCIQIFHFAKR